MMTAEEMCPDFDFDLEKIGEVDTKPETVATGGDVAAPMAQEGMPVAAITHYSSKGVALAPEFLDVQVTCAEPIPLGLGYQFSVATSVCRTHSLCVTFGSI